MLKKLFGLMAVLMVFGMGGVYAVCIQGDGDLLCHDFESADFLTNINYNSSLYTISQDSFGLSGNSMHLEYINLTSDYDWDLINWDNITMNTSNQSFSVSAYFYCNDTDPDGNCPMFLGIQTSDTGQPFTGYICGARLVENTNAHNYWLFRYDNDVQTWSETSNSGSYFADSWEKVTFAINSSGFVSCLDPDLHNLSHQDNGVPLGVGTFSIIIGSLSSVLWTDLYVDNITASGGAYFQPSCTPDWVCSGYGACNISDLAPCNSVSDNNACNVSYTGNFSEFSPQACNYCSSDSVFLNYGYCDTGTGLRNDTYIDNNFATCCNITQIIPADCPYGAVQETSVVNNSCTSNYISTYATADITEVVIDGLVIFLIGLVGLVGVIVLVLMFKWGKVQMRGKQ